MKKPFLFFAICLAAFPALAFEGRVVSVHDGDTVGVLTSAHEYIRVRLADIDAPELGQPFGQRSKRAMSDLVFGKTVAVEDHGLDQYGRTIGIIFAPFNANEEL